MTSKPSAECCSQENFCVLQLLYNNYRFDSSKKKKKVLAKIIMTINDIQYLFLFLLIFVSRGSFAHSAAWMLNLDAEWNEPWDN